MLQHCFSGKSTIFLKLCNFQIGVRYCFNRQGNINILNFDTLLEWSKLKNHHALWMKDFLKTISSFCIDPVDKENESEN